MRNERTVIANDVETRSLAEELHAAAEKESFPEFGVFDHGLPRVALRESVCCDRVFDFPVLEIEEVVVTARAVEETDHVFAFLVAVFFHQETWRFRKPVHSDAED